MTGNEAIVFKNGTIIQTKKDGVDLVKGATPPPPFPYDFDYFEHSPEVQKAIDNIMDRLAMTPSDLIITSVPMEPGFFYETWKDTIEQEPPCVGFKLFAEAPDRGMDKHE